MEGGGGRGVEKSYMGEDKSRQRVGGREICTSKMNSRARVTLEEADEAACFLAALREEGVCMYTWGSTISTLHASVL